MLGDRVKFAYAESFMWTDSTGTNVVAFVPTNLVVVDGNATAVPVGPDEPETVPATFLTATPVPKVMFAVIFEAMYVVGGILLLVFIPLSIPMVDIDTKSMKSMGGKKGGKTKR